MHYSSSVCTLELSNQYFMVQLSLLFTSHDNSQHNLSQCAMCMLEVSLPVFSVTTCLPRYLVRRCLCYNYHSGSSHLLASPWQSTASCLSLPGNWGLFIFVILPHNLQPEAGIILMIYHMEAGHHISNLLPDISISFNTKFGILMKDFLIEKPPARTSLWGNIAVLA